MVFDRGSCNGIWQGVSINVFRLVGFINNSLYRNDLSFIRQYITTPIEQQWVMSQIKNEQFYDKSPRNKTEATNIRS